MQRFEHVVVNQNGTFLPGVSVAVNVANASPGTGAAASLFSDEGITGTGNPATSDSNGRVAFYVADGKYDLTFSGVGITTYIRAALEIADMTGTTFAADVQGKFNTLAVVGLSSLSNVIINPCALGTGAALTVGGTTTTTGGISVFVGALGAQTERFAIVPADGSTAATRVGSLSVRLISGGFLVGNQVAGISATGVLSLSTATGTLPANINNDTAGGITFSNNAGGSMQFGNGGTLFLNVLGGGIRWSGATSGTTVVQAAATAGAGTLTLPGNINDILVGKTTTDIFTNKTLTGATTGNNVLVLNAQGATTAITGTGADAVIYTYTLPANTVDTTSKGIRITCAANHNSGTANPTVKINVNGVAVVTGVIGTTATQSVTFVSTILRTASTTGESAGIATVAGALNPFSITLTGLAWTSNQTITMTFNVAATDQMTGRMFLVEQIQ